MKSQTPRKTRKSGGRPGVIDRVELLRPYIGKWVVLSGDETKVLAFGDDPKMVMRQIPKDEVEEILLTLVPPANSGMIL
jgi:hypothetical protein